MVILCQFLLKTKSGKPTAFAKRYSIYDWNNLYKFFKKQKNYLHTDNEDRTFSNLVEAAKSLFGRTSAWIMASFNAMIFNWRILGFVLDNLNELKKAFKLLQEQSKAIEEEVNRLD